jgi:hypothetical protein
MCELLVRTVDKVNADDKVTDNVLTKAGDVIVVCPDGWVWSETEKAAPFWTIIKVPGAPVSWGEQFLGKEITDVSNPKARAVSLDLSLLTKTTVTQDEVLAAKEVKPATVADDVLGDSKVVL